jgi:hypothetical protein
MNERLNQLAEQAFNEYESVYKSDANIPKEFTEKFAQLIVRECISKLEEEIYRSIDNEGDEIWPDLILKKHFGVEE